MALYRNSFEIVHVYPHTPLLVGPFRIFVHCWGRFQEVFDTSNQKPHLRPKSGKIIFEFILIYDYVVISPYVKVF